MNVTLIGVPYDLDQAYVGKGKAPEALIDAGLPRLLGELGCQTVLAEMVDIPAGDEPPLARIGQLMGRVGYEVARSRAAGFFPLVVGGDCLVSLGAIAGLIDTPNTGVAWIDAHGDFNTPDITISGYLGGMPLACAVGRGLPELRAQAKLAEPVPEANVVLLGARDLDPLEERALAGSAVTQVRDPNDTRALNKALDMLRALPQLYLHIDIDVLDPAEAPGVDYPAARGLSIPQLRALVGQLAGLGNLAALSLTAVNPEKDVDERTVQAGLAAIEAAFRGVLRAED